MKRRDLLKNVGTLALGVPAIGRSAFGAAPAAAPATKKQLVVAFTGPFCFWADPEYPTQTKVIAPPIGRDYRRAPHEPWFGTTTNEKVIEVGLGHIAPATNLLLSLDGYVSPVNPTFSGVTPFSYKFGPQNGVAPLFTLTVPNPDVIIGVRATLVKMVCSNQEYQFCKQYTAFASGLSFVYNNVPPEKVLIKNGSQTYFTPCFNNDEALNDLTLGVNLSPLRRLDEDHKHAQQVWLQMLSMFPWMYDDIQGIDFCPNFDPSNCTLEPGSCTGQQKQPMMPTVGPGNDCQVPIMSFSSPGPTKQKR